MLRRMHVELLMVSLLESWNRSRSSGALATRGWADHGRADRGIILDMESRIGSNHTTVTSRRLE